MYTSLDLLYFCVCMYVCMYARIIYCAIHVYTCIYIYKCVSVTIYVSVLFSRQVSMAEISSERNSKSESSADGPQDVSSEGHGKAVRLKAKPVEDATGPPDKKSRTLSRGRKEARRLSVDSRKSRVPKDKKEKREGKEKEKKRSRREPARSSGVVRHRSQSRGRGREKSRKRPRKWTAARPARRAASGAAQASTQRRRRRKTPAGQRLRRIHRAARSASTAGRWSLVPPRGTTSTSGPLNTVCSGKHIMRSRKGGKTGRQQSRRLPQLKKTRLADASGGETKRCRD